MTDITKLWHETDAHRDLSRIIPDMESKVAEAETRFAHCLPPHLFAPLKSSIEELRVLRHDLATTKHTPLEVELLKELQAICDMQKAFEGDGITTHIRLMKRCASARALIARATASQE